MTEAPPGPDFTPVPLRARRDGWTPARQRAFLIALARSGCVAAACRTVGKAPSAAYALRDKPGAASFGTAWDAALACARQAGITPLRDDGNGPDARRLRLLLRHHNPLAGWP